jgi:primosomal protein N''
MDVISKTVKEIKEQLSRLNPQTRNEITATINYLAQFIQNEREYLNRESAIKVLKSKIKELRKQIGE